MIFAASTRSLEQVNTAQLRPEEREIYAITREITMTKVKICGCRTPEDIKHAAEAGADFVGMVLAPNTTRFVPAGERSALVETAQHFGTPGVRPPGQPYSGWSDEAKDWYPGDWVRWHGQEGLSGPLLIGGQPSARWRGQPACVNMQNFLANIFC